MMGDRGQLGQWTYSYAGGVNLDHDDDYGFHWGRVDPNLDWRRQREIVTHLAGPATPTTVELPSFCGRMLRACWTISDEHES